MPDEDKRTAAGMMVTLSSQIMAASLVMLPIDVGALYFIYANRAPALFFFLFTSFAFVLFVISIIFGSLGITEIRNEGYRGVWGCSTGRKKFSLQTLTCMFGLTMLFLSVFFIGQSKQERVDTDLSAVKKEINHLSLELTQLKDH